MWVRGCSLFLYPVMHPFLSSPPREIYSSNVEKYTLRKILFFSFHSFYSAKLRKVSFTAYNVTDEIRRFRINPTPS